MKKDPRREELFRQVERQSANGGTRAAAPPPQVGTWLRWAVVTGAATGGLYPALLTAKDPVSLTWETDDEVRLEGPNGETLVEDRRYLSTPAGRLSGEFPVFQPVAVGEGGTGPSCDCPRPLAFGLHADSVSLWVLDADGVTIAGSGTGSVTVPWQRDSDDTNPDPVGPHSAIWWLGGSGGAAAFFKCSNLYGWMFNGTWGGVSYGPCRTEAGTSSQSVTAFQCDPFCMEITLDSGVRMRLWAAGTTPTCVPAPAEDVPCPDAIPDCGCPSLEEGQPPLVCKRYTVITPELWCGDFADLPSSGVMTWVSGCLWQTAGYAGSSGGVAGWQLVLSGGSGTLTGVTNLGAVITYSVSGILHCSAFVMSFASSSTGATPGSGLPAAMATLTVGASDCCGSSGGNDPCEATEFCITVSDATGCFAGHEGSWTAPGDGVNYATTTPGGSLGVFNDQDGFCTYGIECSGVGVLSVDRIPFDCETGAGTVSVSTTGGTCRISCSAGACP